MSVIYCGSNYEVNSSLIYVYDILKGISRVYIQQSVIS